MRFGQTPEEAAINRQIKERWEWEGAGAMVAFAGLFVLGVLAVVVHPPPKANLSPLRSRAG